MSSDQPDRPARPHRRRRPEDRGRGRDRRHHVDPGHHRRQRRAADVPDGVRQPRPPDRLLHGRLVGHRLHARAGHRDPDDRLGRRPVRHQAALHDRHRAVRHRLGAVRDRVEHRRPDRLPGPAGPRRRHADAARHDDHDPGGGTAPDGPADGDPRGPDAARPDPRPDHRRLADPGRELALDLPDQRADRPGRDRLRLAGAAQGHPRAVGVLRLPRHGADVARAGAVPVRRVLHPRRGHGHRPAGLGLDADRRRADGARSSSTRSAPSTRCSTCGCSRTATSRSRSSPCSCSPRRSSAGCCWCRPTSRRSAGSRRCRPACSSPPRASAR